MLTTYCAVEAPDLFAACRSGDLPSVRAALCGGVDPNSYHMGQTPLMYACECGHADVARLLIANGAKVDALDSYHRTALHLAVKNLHTECCAVLMEAGASNAVVCNLGGETPADIAHMRGTLEIVRVVLYNNAAQKVSPTNSTAPQPAQNTAATTQVAAKQEPAQAVAQAPAPAPAPDVKEGALPGALCLPRRPPPPELDQERRVMRSPPKEAH